MTPSVRGLMLGALGVLIFSLTMPITKIALSGDVMSAWFVWAGRAVLAAFAGIAYLLLTKRKLPPRAAWWPLIGTAAGVVFGPRRSRNLTLFRSLERIQEMRRSRPSARCRQ
ncbi:hypothetical protein [Candidatus Accumulibacter sp. ACC003]|uniref:hypothetical protein n=1 Tax=Candidatus Accumulibacter sp. ACC003 TaxID=2823334 RepID=UPI0025C6CD85|nr:hypothetical protein [Candidatus Accumulibacter sp. ACC003]